MTRRRLRVRRPRVMCPSCHRDTAITTRERLWAHRQCPAAGHVWYLAHRWPSKHDDRWVAVVPGPDIWNPTTPGDPHA